MADEIIPMDVSDEESSPMDISDEELFSVMTTDQNYDADPIGPKKVKPPNPLQNQPCRELAEEDEFDRPAREGHDTSVEGNIILHPKDWIAIAGSNLENDPDGTAVTAGQTEMGSRQFGDQCTTGQPGTASEFSSGSTRVRVEVDAGSVNEGCGLFYVVFPVKNQLSEVTVITSKATGNPVSDGQTVNTDELHKNNRDVSQNSRNPKRKTSDEDAPNKKCKVMNQEEERKEKERDYAENYPEDKKSELPDLKECIEKYKSENQILKEDNQHLQNENQVLKEDNQRLQNENQVLKNQNQTEGHFRADRPENHGVSESVPNSPQTAKNGSGERELTEKMNKVLMEACDPEKFLKIMNEWLSSKGMSEIRLSDEGPIAGVRSREDEIRLKTLIIEFYRNVESSKKIRDDLVHSGLM
ncbi:uncharacterized protein [Macrobrachium rosenbergii]|uniref:uncharacterized protein n=1 Tax=Macrobrachium rosenbergii TaxID=79674 RepID=UPI0034D57069